VDAVDDACLVWTPALGSAHHVVPSAATSIQESVEVVLADHEREVQGVGSPPRVGVVDDDIVAKADTVASAAAWVLSAARHDRNLTAGVIVVRGQIATTARPRRSSRHRRRCRHWRCEETPDN
jgi:hypothetical protein